VLNFSYGKEPVGFWSDEFSYGNEPVSYSECKQLSLVNRFSDDYKRCLLYRVMSNRFSDDYKRCLLYRVVFFIS
jgi:hypothetical protein